MYSAFYHWRIKPGREQDFVRLWSEGTLLFRDEQNTLGSRLHKADDGTYFAYAQWPSADMFHGPRTLSPHHTQVLKDMRDCVEQSFPAVLGEVLVDCLVK